MRLPISYESTPYEARVCMQTENAVYKRYVDLQSRKL